MVKLGGVASKPSVAHALEKKERTNSTGGPLGEWRRDCEDGLGHDGQGKEVVVRGGVNVDVHADGGRCRHEPVTRWCDEGGTAADSAKTRSA
ncbi:hypothetical protein DEO72_LG10g2165 [Vigna unguiculata]|uniref:Uncharacterized protein n=1 Tax=Vigna unguiculata TaxID=3917 RepID=A0A4D6NDF6_VIGUN|nr:hypothetical protein DEO72_LG10g2165 [Vigna unguiculata]